MNSNNKTWLIPESYLQQISASQTVGEVVQEVLSQGRLYPLALQIPMSISSLENSQQYKGQRGIQLDSVPYVFQNKTGIARVRFPTELLLPKSGTGTIDLQKTPNIVLPLHYEIRRQIMDIMQYASMLQESESIRRIDISKKIQASGALSLMYSDKDSNTYHLYAPEIHFWKSITQKDLHSYIRGVYMEKFGRISYYQVINSYQESRWKDKKIFLHIIESSTFNQHFFIKLALDTRFTNHDISLIAERTQTIWLCVDAVRNLYERAIANRRKK